MRIVWKVTLVVSLLIGVLALGTYIFLHTQDINRYKGLIGKAVTSATGRQLVIGGDLELSVSLDPILILNAVTFANAPWSQQPQMAEVGRLHVQVELLPLLLGDLVLERLNVSDGKLLLETSTSGEGNWEFRSDSGKGMIKRFSAQHIGLENIDVDFQNEERGWTTHLKLAKLEFTESASADRAVVDLEGSWDGREVALAGEAGDLGNVLATKRLPLDVSGEIAGTKVSLDGAIEDLSTLQGMSLKLQANGTDLAPLGQSFGLNLPATGSFDLTAGLEGSASALKLDDIQGAIDGPDVSLSINGSVDSLNELSGVALRVKAKGSDASQFSGVVEKELPETGAFEVEAELTGTAKAITLENASGSLDWNGLTWTANGTVAELAALQGIDAHATVSGASLTKFGELFEQSWPETGPFEISGQLTGSPQTLALANGEGKLRRDDAVLTITGNIANLINLSGVDVRFQGSGTNLAAIGPIGGKELPNTDAFDVSGHLDGSAKALELEEARATLKGNDLEIALEGSIADLIALSGFDLQIRGSGQNLAVLRPWITERVPDTGPFKVAGQLTGSRTTLALSNAQALVSRESMTLTADGSVNNLLNFSDLDVRLKVAGNDLEDIGSVVATKLPTTDVFELDGRLQGSAKALALGEAEATLRRGDLQVSAVGSVADVIALTGIDVRVSSSGQSIAELRPVISEKLPESGPFTISAAVTGSKDQLGLVDVLGIVEQGSAQIKITGKVEDVRSVSGVDLKLKGWGKRFSDFGPMFKTDLPELGFFDVGADLKGSSEAFIADNISVFVDRSDFKGTMKLESRERPKITVLLESGLVDLTPVIQDLKAEGQRSEGAENKGESWFSDEPLPFHLLNAVDADISLKARRIRGRNAEFHFGNISMRLEEGELRLDNLELSHGETKFSGSMDIKTVPSTHVGTKFLVQHFDLGRFLDELGVTAKIDGEADAAVDLRGRGDSPRELAANLNGTISFVLGPGRVPDVLDVLAEGLHRRVINIWGEEKGELECGVMYFGIEDGIVTIQVFVIETTDTIARATGELELSTEELDVWLTANPKRLTLFSFPPTLHVTGNWFDPQVRVDKAAAAERGGTALGALAVGPLGLMAPFVSLGAADEHPCDVKDYDAAGQETTN